MIHKIILKNIIFISQKNRHKLLETVFMGMETFIIKFKDTHKYNKLIKFLKFKIYN